MNEVLVLLRDECLALAHALNRRATLGEDVALGELRRRARELAGSLTLFSGADTLHHVLSRLNDVETRLESLEARARDAAVRKPGGAPW